MDQNNYHRRYYFLVALISNLIFLALAFLIMLPTQLIHEPVFIWIFIGFVIYKFLLLFGYLLISPRFLLTEISHQKAMIILGWYPVRLLGGIIGWFLGVSLAGPFGGVVSAFGLYLLARWGGPKVSNWIGKLMKGVFPDIEYSD